LSKHIIIHLPQVGEDYARWAVADDSGKLVSAPVAGTLSEAANAVEGRRATLVLPGDGVTLSEAVVPGGSLVRAQQAVPYVLEEQLADDVETLHFALGSKGKDDNYPVAVIDRDTMDTVTAQCVEAGLRPGEIVPETLALPKLDAGHDGATAWTALYDNESTVVRLNGHRGFSAEADMVGMMLNGARANLPEDSSASLVIYSTEPEVFLDIPEGIELETRHCDDRLALYASGLANTPRINLLQGDYSPKTHFDKAWKPWRWSAVLVGALALALFGSTWLDYRQLKQQEAAIDSTIKSVFEEAMPGVRLVRPKKQMQSALDKLGAGGTSGFIASLGQIVGALETQPQTQLRSISYRKGRFNLDLTTDTVATLDALSTELANRGSLKMTVKSANREEGGVRGRVEIQ